jgi:hypothetical protein
MSKGSPVRSVRLDDQLLRIVEQQIESRNMSTAEAEYGVSGFIAAAIREKLLKMARSRESHARKRLYQPRRGLLTFGQLRVLLATERAARPDGDQAGREHVDPSIVV